MRKAIIIIAIYLLVFNLGLRKNNAMIIFRWQKDRCYDIGLFIFQYSLTTTHYFKWREEKTLKKIVTRKQGQKNLY